MAERTYIVGDVHGDFDKLLCAHERIGKDHGDLVTAPIVHVGDLVDRRFKARETLQYMVDAADAGKPWVSLLGNHDRLFLKFLTDPDWIDTVLRPDYSWTHPNMGGLTTLASYGINISDNRTLSEMQQEAVAKEPPAHVDFLKSMPLFHLVEDVLIVHAGIRPGIALEMQTEDDLVWIRKEFHDFPDEHQHLVIHGHSVIKSVTHYGNRVNIDTGCAYGHDLNAIVVEGRDIWVLEQDGRRPLPPPT